MNNEAQIEELSKSIVEKDELIWKLKKELDYKNRMLAVMPDLIKAVLDKQ